MTIIYFILILGITVFIHELGHFMFAKKYGVYVYEFSIGMGPKLFKFKRKNDETEYCIRLLPIGGFVQMAGEEVEVDEKIPENMRLQSKSAFKRFMIMIAGVMMNFLLGIVLYFFIGLFNTVSLDNVYVDGSTIDNLNDNDKIVAINNKFVNNYDKLALELTIADEQKFTMQVKTPEGKKKNIDVTPYKIGSQGLLYGKDYGFSVSDTEISDSTRDDIKVGDKIIKVNGVDVSDHFSLIRELSLIDGKDFSLTLQSSSDVDDENVETRDVIVTVSENKDDKLQGYSYGFYIKGKEGKGFISAIKYAFSKFFSTIEQMIFTVFYLITGKISLSMLSGPVGIFNVVSVYSHYGIANIVALLALICINVGFINILPLPAFDGGHILFIIIEKMKGSRVDPKVENTIHNIGFILLMLLMVLVTYNDIIKLF